MDKKKIGLIGTVAILVLCGCPGLCMIFSGIISKTDLKESIPFIENLSSNTGMLFGAGILLLCFSTLIGISIAFVVILNDQQRQSIIERTQKLRWTMVDFGNGIMGKKEKDSEINKLINIDRSNNQDFKLQVNLGVAYLAKFDTPPNLDQNYASKAFQAFRKALTIAKKQDQAQIATIQNKYLEAIREVSLAYRSYFDTYPEVKWLNFSAWLLEEIMPDFENQPEVATQIREDIKQYRVDILDWYEKSFEEKVNIEKNMGEYLKAVDRTIQYFDESDPMRSAIEIDAAITQLNMGSHYADLAGQSAVIGKQDGSLLKIDDKQHKDYAIKAINYLRSSRGKINRHPDVENFEEYIVAANTNLAYAYTTLYNLTWAHSRMEESIKILQQAVKIVPDSADLWHSLGEAYKTRAEEFFQEYKPSSGAIATAVLVPSKTFARVAGQRDRKKAQKKYEEFLELSTKCFLRARQLAPEKY